MKYNDETIILIEYNNGIPSSVFTESNVYDFNVHVNGWLMFHNSGFGKNYEIKYGKKIITDDIIFPYCSPNEWSIWIDGQYELSLIQKGVTVLRKPIMLSAYLDSSEKHNNPFVFGEEVDEIYYCEECDGYYTDDGCPDHERKEEY